MQGAQALLRERVYFFCRVGRAIAPDTRVARRDLEIMIHLHPLPPPPLPSGAPGLAISGHLRTFFEAPDYWNRIRMLKLIASEDLLSEVCWFFFVI